ncbi:hypothetical protein AV530_005515 [Patagioenas fasciata monilis]|uniref:Uncharacterized protein n=1 Tax=Patagioenas fasciata monilis TaxID=372326 RepID=A0A1V4JM35_PATFA|nr:hypothetical protein AV530_005515 [Patagioenas fasciata monilis]
MLLCSSPPGQSPCHEAQCNSCAQEKRNLPCQRPVEEEEGGEEEDNRAFDSNKVQSEAAEVILESAGRDIIGDHVNLVISPCSHACIPACILDFDCHIYSGLAAGQTPKTQ